MTDKGLPLGWRGKDRLESRTVELFRLKLKLTIPSPL